MADEEKTDYFTCGIVQKYVDVAAEFTRDLSGELLGPMWALFLALAGLWIVIQGLRLMIAHTSWADIVKQSLFVALAGFLLAGQGQGLVDRVFSASLNTMGSAASVALSVGAQETREKMPTSSEGTVPLKSGMVALVDAAETGVWKVFQMAGQEAISREIWNPLPWLFALLLVLPYFLVLVVYFSQVVVAIFRIMMLAVLSPFLMLRFGFGWDQEMMKSGIRTLLSSFMVLFGVTGALAVML